MSKIFEFRIENPKPRPSFRIVAEHLWGQGVDFDSDGNAIAPEDPNWTELTLIKRPDYRERVDIVPVSQSPLVLKVSSASRDLALRTANFLTVATHGNLIRDPEDR